MIYWTNTVEQYCNRGCALLQAVPHENEDVLVKTLVAAHVKLKACSTPVKFGESDRVHNVCNAHVSATYT